MFLDQIVTQTRIDLEQRKREIPPEDVKRLAAAQPEPRNLRQALYSGATIRLIAEVKRASPSKGLLAPDLDPVELARTYEANGAAAISVLTEPHFFLGSPAYLTAIKQAVNIPVLRKDFIFDEYQVFEARAWGADAILLICAILDDDQLQHLLQVAHGLHMQCLVEVHSEEEARRAVTAGAVIIGVNSRDLTTFQLHPNLIRELRRLIPKDRVVVAESGIHTAVDAHRLSRYDVKAMLVGESLVASNDVSSQMRTLLRGANMGVQVKICGLRTPHHLHTCIEAGADMVGLMFYEPSPRYIPPAQARELLDTIENLAGAPDIIGVFVNKEANFIHDIAEQVGLDFVQLHGSELPEFCQQIRWPVIKGLRLHSGDDIGLIRAYRETTWRILLDTPSSHWGGSGMTHNWNLAYTVAQEMPVLLAGGLTPENVGAAISQVRPWGVDVSSGVETFGQKDGEKIRAFIQQVHNATDRQEE
jgi:indole-3-glycerol phosphate synthase/phosphoribosylanthranilate isomerase/anthranilate synthase/indole-3-glycerol phosphate synthase/phosphoribosylanthranilate isomerase